MIIVCQLDLFTVNQSIHIINPETKKEQVVFSSLNNLSKNIGKICDEQEEWEIDLYGEDQYIENKLIPEVMDYALANYSRTDNIRFEVNKKWKHF